MSGLMVQFLELSAQSRGLGSTLGTFESPRSRIEESYFGILIVNNDFETNGPNRALWP